MSDLTDQMIKCRQCEKCGAKWINDQLYWATGKKGKNDDLAGLVCNTVHSPECINPEKGSETGDTWEKRLGKLKQLTTVMEKEYDIKWDSGSSGSDF